MLTFDLPVEPYWLNLHRGLPGEIRPVTTAVMTAAQLASFRRLGAVRASDADLDPDMARGFALVRLMDMDDMAAAFWERATSPAATVAREGNG